MDEGGEFGGGGGGGAGAEVDVYAENEGKQTLGKMFYFIFLAGNRAGRLFFALGCGLAVQFGQSGHFISLNAMFCEWDGAAEKKCFVCLRENA